jgi:hypothetical protein
MIGLAGLNGALQRAINVCGINGGVNYLNSNLDPIEPDDNDRVFRVSPNKSQGHPMILYSEMRHYLDSEHLAGNPAGEPGQLMSHSPGFVTQGDLLSMIGSALVARGDTFLIRTYGDTMLPGQSSPVSRAWLEAIVQRIPDPVLPDPLIPTEPAPASPYGRKFKILHIRWLLPEDV